MFHAISVSEKISWTVFGKTKSCRSFALLIFVLVLFCPVPGITAVLLNWNEPNSSGQAWTGYTWFNDASGWGEPGWRRNDYDSNWLMPRFHAKTDYGSTVTAEIDAQQRAPGSSGASLKVRNTGGDSTAGWWYLWRDNFGTQKLADSATNRLSFYFRPTGFSSQSWTNDIEDYNVHLGTYLCWSGGGLGGEDCPKEASGQHYYHWLTVNPDAWLHVVMDRHPQHKRGESPVPNDNPASPRNYFEYMSGFYLELFAGSNPQTYWVDEMELYQANQPENDISISSVWVGYWPSTNKWEMGWMDGSFSSYGNSSQSTFEIRWSTAPITNANYGQASVVVPEANKYGNNLVQRPNPWKLPAWTRFTLPAGIPGKVYFAIKDVSSTGNGDGHNSPSTYIKTIDYTIQTGSGGTTLDAPSNLHML